MSTVIVPGRRQEQGVAGPAVWIDDPHPIFRRGLAACLSAAGFRAVGDSCGFEPQPEVRHVDLLLFYLDNDGLRQAVRLTRESDVRLVALCAADGEELVYAAVEAGVAGVLMRGEIQPHTLTDALRAVACGSVALPSDLLPRLLHGAAHNGTSAIRGLVERERAVLRLLASGDDTRQIAERLGYSERTVKNVVHDLLVKMNCRNRAHAVAQATRMGLI